MFSLIIFLDAYPRTLLSKSERYCASWLIAKHGLQREDGMIPYSEIVDYNGRDWYKR